MFQCSEVPYIKLSFIYSPKISIFQSDQYTPINKTGSLPPKAYWVVKEMKE